MSALIGENLKEGGYFISSGIINTKEQEVKEALIDNKFKIIEINRMKDWVSFVAQKNKVPNLANTMLNQALLLMYLFLIIKD